MTLGMGVCAGICILCVGLTVCMWSLWKDWGTRMERKFEETLEHYESEVQFIRWVLEDQARKASEDENN